MVAAPYEMFNMGNKTHPQQPDIGNCNFFNLLHTIYGYRNTEFKEGQKNELKKKHKYKINSIER